LARSHLCGAVEFVHKLAARLTKDGAAFKGAAARKLPYLETRRPARRTVLFIIPLLGIIIYHTPVWLHSHEKRSPSNDMCTKVFTSSAELNPQQSINRLFVLIDET
jgi:hypothetical protein